jgi:hypothetical protein
MTNRKWSSLMTISCIFPNSQHTFEIVSVSGLERNDNGELCQNVQWQCVDCSYSFFELEPISQHDGEVDTE